jgi:TANFOR domain-containing protein
MKKVLLFFTIYLCAIGSLCSQIIRVSTQVLPPYSQYITDYQSRPGQILITLTNLGRSNQQVQLVGSIVGDNGVAIRTKAGYRSARPVLVPGGSTIRVSQADIMGLFDNSALNYAGTSANEILRKNTLPEGMYQICVQALNYQSLQTLSEGEPQGCSAPFPLQSLEPPIWIRPANDEIITAPTAVPQNLVFGWTTPASAPPATRYRLRIFEHFSPARNPNDIVRAAGLALFDQTVLGNTYLYGPGQPQLQRGRSYVAIVQAVDPSGRQSVFRNDGVSEPVVFQYGTEATTSPTNTPKQITSTPTPTADKLPKSKIKGRIMWDFKTAVGQNFISTPLIETAWGNSNTTESLKYIWDVNYNGADKEHPSAPNANNSLGINYHLSNNITPNNKVTNNSNTSQSNTGNYMILGGVNTLGTTIADKKIIDKVNTIALDKALVQPAAKKYPLANTSVKIYALRTGYTYYPNLENTGTFINYTNPPNNKTKPSVQANTKPEIQTSIKANSLNIYSNIEKLVLSDKMHIATTTTNAEGNFEVDFLNPGFFSNGYDRLALEIDHEDFAMEATVLKIKQFNSDENAAIHDFGTVNAEALNYAFSPKIVDEEGNKLTNVEIKIYRSTVFYNNNTNHSKEGNSPQPRANETVKGIAENATLIGKCRSSQAIYNLFFNHNYSQRYYMVIEKEGFMPLVSDLQVQRSSYEIDVPIIVKTIMLERTLPTVKGTVSLLKDGVSVPISGASVSIYFDDAWKTKLNPPTNNLGFSAAAVLASWATTNTKLTTEPINISNSVKNNSDYFNILQQSSQNVGNFIQENVKKMATVTDESGSYIFKNIPINTVKNAYYYIVTTAPGISKPKLDSVICDTKGLPDKVVNIVIAPEMIAVTGRVVDAENKPIPEPIIKWKSDGRVLSGGGNGVFLTKNTAGYDSLIISKFGYAEKRIRVNVQKPTNSTGGGTKASSPVFWQSITATASYKAGATPDLTGPEVFGSFVNKNLPTTSNTGSSKKPDDGSYLIAPASMANLAYMDVFKASETYIATMDLGDIKLEKRVGKIRFIVKATDTNLPLAGVHIALPDYELSGSTDATGKWYVEGPSGNILASITAPAASGYAPQEVSVTTLESGVTEFSLSLDKGILVTGQVTAAGVAVQGANLTVDGREYIKTTTNASGQYNLVVPPGEYTLKASKTGYVGTTATRTFVMGSPQTVNLALGDAGGRDLTKMLGFDIEVEQLAGNTISGYFINFKPMGPFNAIAGKKLKFTNINVTWDSQNKPIPAGNQVISNDTQLDFKAFSFLPLRVTKAGGLVIKRDVANKGVVQGLVEISVDQVLGSSGLAFPEGFKPNLATTAASTPTDLSVFTEDGSFPYGAEFFMGTALAMAGDKFEDSKLKIKLYNFEARIDLGQCAIRNDGLHLVGGIKTTGIPLLGDRTFEFEQFHVGTDFGIKAAQININPAPTLTIVSWSATLNSLGFNENGFKVGGSMKFKLPSSAESVLSFSNLKFGLGTVFGGSFNLPESGVDVFSVLQFKPGSTPLSFGQLGSTGVYYVAGSGRFNLPKPIEKTLTLKTFQIQTDLKFAATVEANIKVDFLSVAKLQIIDIGFNALGAQPTIDVNGAFTLQIPFFKATVGGVHFKPSGVTVDELGAGFDIVGVAKVDVRLKMIDSPEHKGFEGEGGLGIVGTPINAKLGFHYYKVPGGVDVGAKFAAGVLIPIGVVTIERVGGGFQLNTATNKFYVNINGAASFAGTGPLIKMDPIQVEVWSGPIIKGTLGITVASVIQGVNATVLIDAPQSYFAVAIDANLSPLPNIVQARAQGDFILSAKPSNKYMFFGAGYYVNLLGLVTANGGLAIGANMANAKTHERSSFHLAEAPAAYMNGTTFTGIYVYASTSMGVDKDHAWGFDVSIASAKAWLYNSSKFHFISNFANGDFQIRSRMKFGGGAEGCVVGLCAGAGLDACLDLAGGHNQSQGWNFNGNAEGSGSFSAGCSADCNSIGWVCDCCCPVPCGFKICVNAKLNVVYASKPSGHLGLSFSLGGAGSCAGF